MRLSDDITRIPFIGPKYQKLFGKLGISTIEDLLYYFPIKYQDTSQISQISSLSVFEKKTILAEVEEIKNFRTKNGKFITEAIVSDNSGKINVIWFNQPFLTNVIKAGSKILLNGKLNPNRNKPQLYSPTYEIPKNNHFTHLGLITPIYSITSGISSKFIRAKIKYVLENHPKLIESIKDTLPHFLRKRYDLIDLPTAISQIHFPKSKISLKNARKRLAFNELLDIQLKLVKEIRKRRLMKSVKIKQFSKEVSNFLDNLEFKPTRAQILAIKEILQDFKKAYPANRLLQGDVGCGKTIVAAGISIPVIKSGYQVVILSPTSILANQHYNTFMKLFSNSNFKIKLITSKTVKSKEDFKDADILIGTHALLFNKERFYHKIGLIIVDEQHRFGVEQRNLLVSWANSTKNREVPHKLTMTATPIPRSIALTFFGNLDLTIIDEMPKGRKPTKTFLVPHNKYIDACRWIEKMIISKTGVNTKEKTHPGKQENLNLLQEKNKICVFWLCPLIEESEKLQTSDVLTKYNSLKNEIFPNLQIDMLHGRLSEEEKNEKIKKMKEGKIDILVSTSVIEVGMDIENARIIVIEGAERFGLAQLHQLRGRVGRRAGQDSWCFLFTSKGASSEAIKRLKYFSKIDNGLKVAEFDLKNRGPGEVYGTKQSGIPDLKVAKITDLKLVKQAREAAEELIFGRND